MFPVPEEIRKYAERTYKRVLLGKNPGLVANSCDFSLLEERCVVYMQNNKNQSLEDKINEAISKQISPPKKVMRCIKHQNRIANSFNGKEK